MFSPIKNLFLLASTTQNKQHRDRWSMFSAIPLVGEDIVFWLRGGFAGNTAQVLICQVRSLWRFTQSMHISTIFIPQNFFVELGIKPVVALIASDLKATVRQVYLRTKVAATKLGTVQFLVKGCVHHIYEIRWNAARVEQILGEFHISLAQPQLDDVTHVLVCHVKVGANGAENGQPIEIFSGRR